MDNLIWEQFPSLLVYLLLTGSTVYYLRRKISFKRRCTCCDQPTLWRISRPWWIKNISNSRAYQCNHCNREFFYIPLGKVSDRSYQPAPRLSRLAR